MEMTLLSSVEEIRCKINVTSKAASSSCYFLSILFGYTKKKKKRSFHLRDRIGVLSQSYFQRNFLSSITLNLCLKK